MATEGIREKSPLSVKDSFFILLYELSLSDDVRTLSKRTSDEVTENDYQMKKDSGHTAGVPRKLPAYPGGRLRKSERISDCQMHAHPVFELRNIVITFFACIVRDVQSDPPIQSDNKEGQVVA